MAQKRRFLAFEDLEMPQYPKICPWQPKYMWYPHDGTLLGTFKLRLSSHGCPTWPEMRQVGPEKSCFDAVSHRNPQYCTDMCLRGDIPYPDLIWDTYFRTRASCEALPVQNVVWRAQGRPKNSRCGADSHRNPWYCQDMTFYIKISQPDIILATFDHSRLS